MNSCTYNDDGMAPQDAIAEGIAICGKPATVLMYEPDESTICTLSCADHVAAHSLMFRSNGDRPTHTLVSVANLSAFESTIAQSLQS